LDHLKLENSSLGLVAAKVAEFEMIEVTKFASVTSNTASTQTVALPGWLQKIKAWLRQFASWIWNIIQTLLTPTGWSIEGGVTVHGLVDAKLTINFGK